MNEDTARVVAIANMMVEDDVGYSGYRVYSIDAICPTICASGFKKDIFILVESIDKLDNSVYNEVID